jgi:hypothetical protein
MIDLPNTCAVAFKEWAAVCDALATGRQTLILRKGGVAEIGGAGRFEPDHSLFWLYPTWVHQAEQGVRTLVPESPPIHQPRPDSRIPISALVSSRVLCYVDSEQKLPALEGFHVLTPETVQKRFHYRKPGLWVLAARAWRRSQPFCIELTSEQAGCKTWVPLDQPLDTTGLQPAVDDDEWARLLTHWQSILGGKA